VADQPQQPRTTGTATSRARLVRPAVRRPTLARLALSGPSGSGKTWTALSVAEVLAPGGRVVVIDTERGDNAQGAAELYADTFAFEVLEWPPPYDPRDLALTLDDLSSLPAAERPHVVVLDSASHFWRGQGGTLDIAGGKFGGWKAATPAQDDLVAAILRAGYHVLVCLRARQDYAVEEGDHGKQKVVKLGLAPVQRDDLEYEFQVVVQLDMDHRIDVGKTRAQPLAGGSWPAGQQARFAALYRDWLVSGTQVAPMADVEALRQVLRTAELGPQWQAAGWPKADRLNADQLDAAWTWLGQQLGIARHVAALVGDSDECTLCSASWRARWHDAPGAADAPQPEPEQAEPDAEQAPDSAEEPEATNPVEEGVQPESKARSQGRAEGRQGEAPGPDREAAAEHVAATLGPRS
jgi:hypothetical protein